MDGHRLPVLNLHQHIERWRGSAFQHRLLRASPACFFVGQSHTVNAAHQIAQRGVHQQVVQRIAVSGAYQLYAPLGDGTRRLRFQLTPNLVDDDHLRHVVFNRLDHHLVLETGGSHLHTPGPPDGWMRNISVSCYFIGGIHNDHSLLFGQHARSLAQEGCFAYPGPTQQQDVFP